MGEFGSQGWKSTFSAVLPKQGKGWYKVHVRDVQEM